MVDVIALAKINGSYAGIYRALFIIPTGDPLPETNAAGYAWVRIAKAISEDEAYAILNQYPQATQRK